jgi:hypothetical protein
MMLLLNVGWERESWEKNSRERDEEFGATEIEEAGVESRWLVCPSLLFRDDAIYFPPPPTAVECDTVDRPRQ